MKYELVVRHIQPGESVDIPEGAKMVNAEDPNQFGEMRLTYLAPKK